MVMRKLSRPNASLYTLKLGVGSILALSSLCSCSALLGLDELKLRNDGGPSASTNLEAGTQCLVNADCNPKGDAGGPDGPAICQKPELRCVPLLSPDCTLVSGNYADDRSIVLGALFNLTGAQATTNQLRLNSALLALEEINATGGIPQGTTSANARPLAMVSCDAAMLERAGTHLASELRVPAIIGPNLSQDTLDLSNKVTVKSGTVVMTPTGVASSIGDLLDDGLTWQMVPNDLQRAPLMREQINELETALKRDRKFNMLKLAVVFRDDALGQGTRSGLDELVLNGRQLSDPINLGMNVRMDPFDLSLPDQHVLVDAYTKFLPDVIVLAGTAEVVTQILIPVEAAWPSDKPRPYYVMIDSSKVSELTTAATGNDDLRRRVRGTGVAPGADSVDVYNAFRISYGVRFPASTATVSGMGPSYDAVYAAAFALAATKDLPVSGKNVSAGLRHLTGGMFKVPVEQNQVLAAFQHLILDGYINAIGTFGPLAWGTNGAVQGGTVEIWCIGANNGTPFFASSGLTYDLATSQYTGMYTQCEQ
jgi:ABC-type branched-subunit amino acid transport system substrate-binding protein